MRFRECEKTEDGNIVLHHLLEDWEKIKNEDCKLLPQESDFLYKLSKHYKNEVRAAAVEILCEYGDVDFQMLSEWMKDRDREVRAIALSSVGYSWISAGKLFESDKQKAVETLVSVWTDTKEEYCLIILSDLAFRPEWIDICWNAGLSILQNADAELESILYKVFFSVIIPKIFILGKHYLLEPMLDMSNPKANRMLLSSIENNKIDCEKTNDYLNILSKSNSFEISKRAWSMINKASC
ncbi:MAG: HEAT repeat domain-containing protein [Armatimonadota bacterium]